MNSEPIRLIVIGTGSMAAQHARQFSAIDGVEVVAGVDVDANRVQAFCREHGIERSFTDLDAALEWGAFDAVANVTPDSAHHGTTLQVLARRKHVFCEKPLATSYADAREMTEAAGQAQVIAMVNLSYRSVPALQKARELVTAGKIGDVRHVEASYLQSWLASAYWGDWRTESRWLWRLSKRHGSNGVLGDVGIHILDFASYGVASEIEQLTCRLKAFHKAENDRIGEYVLDANDSFIMTVEFANGALGTIHATRWASGHADDLRLQIFGSHGGLEASYAGKGTDGQRLSQLRACLGSDLETHTWRDVPLEPVENNYERFIRAIRQGETLEPSFARAASLQRLLDLAGKAERTTMGQGSAAGS